jgi:hypothetical protein
VFKASCNVLGIIPFVDSVIGIVATLSIFHCSLTLLRVLNILPVFLHIMYTDYDCLLLQYL